MDTGGLDLRETLATLGRDDERGAARGAAELGHEFAGALAGDDVVDELFARDRIPRPWEPHGPGVWPSWADLARRLRSFLTARSRGTID